MRVPSAKVAVCVAPTIGGRGEGPGEAVRVATAPLAAPPRTVNRRTAAMAHASVG
jgi:hypothetical protein